MKKSETYDGNRKLSLMTRRSYANTDTTIGRQNLSKSRGRIG